MIGTTLGRYRVLDKLGEGGMGEVYAAEDLTLHRQVALKVLSAVFAHDAERRQRFAREAQAVAALNHPNIVTIHSVEQAGDVHFLTMEMVAGKPLSELIPPGGLPLARLLKLAIPLTDAVSTAHQRGITHRDLKPANIMIGDDGRLKVLDFGLAKLKEKELPAGATMLPTQSVTGEGRILGTIAYMSPEQAEGKPVDHRSDIFSLGILLYEMTTGERPFKGDTSLSVLSSIIKDTPRPVTEINRALPRDLARIVRRCLMKEPDDRYQSARDIKNDLEEVKQVLESGEIVPGVAPPVPTVAGRSRNIPVITGAVAATAAAIAAILWLGPKTSPPPSVPIAATFTQLTLQKGIEEYPSLSPDGKWMVYAGNASGNFDVYLHGVGGQTPINLTKDATADDLQPVFSPDGERIAFRSDRAGGGIFVMGRTGESLKRVTDGGYNPAWSPDSKQIAYGTENIVTAPNFRGLRSGLWVVDIDTGNKRQIVIEDAVQPSWSPHGSRIAFWAARGARRQRDILTVASGGGEPALVTDDAAVDWNPIWSADGRHLYFASERGGTMNLWRVAIDEASGRPAGEPEPLTVPSRFVAHLSLSADGRRLAFTSVDYDQNAQRLAFNPATERVEGDLQWVTSGSKIWAAVDATRDGGHIALASGSPQEDVFVAQSDGTGLRQLTNDTAFDRDPRWSADGKRVAFYSNRSGSWEIWTINSDGSNLSQVTKRSGAHHPVWSPDGSRMAFSTIVEQLGVSVFDAAKPWDDQKPRRLPNPAGGSWRASSWSPDGKVIAGVETTSITRVGVIVYALDSGTLKKLTDVGLEPYWLNDSRRLLFSKRPGALAVVDWQTSQARDVWSRPGEDLALASVSGDGRQLFFLRSSKQADIWMATLK